jgi:hypothetical protein
MEFCQGANYKSRAGLGITSDQPPALARQILYQSVNTRIILVGCSHPRAAYFYFRIGLLSRFSAVVVAGFLGAVAIAAHCPQLLIMNTPNEYTRETNADYAAPF